MADTKKTKDVRINTRLLMIETNRDSERPCRFFTPKKHYPYLIEFARTFDARLVDVRVEEAEALPLTKLTEAFCGRGHGQDVEFQEVKDLTPPILPFRSRSVQVAEITSQDTIQRDIKQLLLTGTPLRTKDLYSLFDKHGKSESTIRRYYKTVRVALEEEGYKIKKIARGEYRLGKAK